ncbi:MAG: hypothetical protein Q7U04_05150 [Bacteriovorax sp.]|nr:hypothetical protein [Bacteriovorax sp.]
MKLLVLVCFFTSTSFLHVHAATVNLNVGDTITLQPNTTTTVSCGGENLDCKLPVKNLKTKLDYCKTNNDTTVEECLNQIWPNFRKNNSQCVNQAFETCLTFCKSSFQTLDCLNICD